MRYYDSLVSDSVELDTVFGREAGFKRDIPDHPHDDNFRDSFLGDIDKILFDTFLSLFFLPFLFRSSAFERVACLTKSGGEDPHGEMMGGIFHGGDDDKTVSDFIEEISNLDGLLELGF